jgi:hypothetical protein
MSNRFAVRALAAVAALALLAVSCSTDDADEGAPDSSARVENDAAAGTLEGGGIDPTLTRDDVDCSPATLSGDTPTDFTTAYYVVDGDLGAVCYGDEDPVLIESWETLASIVPGGQLRDLAVFTAFQSLEDGDEETVAFVIAYDDDGSVFQMSVNTPAAEDDPEAAQLTMLHEFSHVFNGLVTQIDRFADPETCETFDNGEGCFLADSLMAEWIDEFWGDGLIDEIDPDAVTSLAAGQERCDADPGFFGAYGASHPEEDFAEAFSAYVFGVPADNDEQQARLDWFDDRPGLAEFRAEAEVAGFEPQENFFDECGLAA